MFRLPSPRITNVQALLSATSRSDAAPETAVNPGFHVFGGGTKPIPRERRGMTSTTPTIYSFPLDEARSSCLILAMLAAMRFVSLRFPERLRRFGFVT
jgi:hypothetical protein